MYNIHCSQQIHCTIEACDNRELKGLVLFFPGVPCIYISSSCGLTEPAVILYTMYISSVISTVNVIAFF